MTYEDSDFAREHARDTDPETSKRAAAEAEDAAKHDKETILRAFEATRSPLSQQDVADLVGDAVKHRESIHKRISDLQGDGRIRWTGNSKKSYVTNKDQQTYVLNPSGEPGPKRTPKWKRVLDEMRADYADLLTAQVLNEYEQRMTR